MAAPAQTTGTIKTKTGPDDPIGSLNGNQVANIKTIIAVGKAGGVTENGIVTALAVANDESTFLNYGSSNVPGSEKGAQAMGHDHMSVGVFQQQVGGFGWGEMPGIMDTTHQAAAFYGITPNASAPGLLQQHGWQTGEPGALAQQVQGSGTPSAYYPLVTFARKLYSTYKDTPPATLPFKPRAVGPLYVEHAVAAAQANPTPAPQIAPSPTPYRDDAIKMGVGLSRTPKAAQAPAPAGPAPAALPGSGGKGNNFPTPAAPPASATPPSVGKGPMKAV